MPTIDADTHVIECDQTWDYMKESERSFRPQIVTAAGPAGPETRYWLIDGRLFPITNVGRDTPVAARELRDIKARLMHMDELDVSVQVIYPTVFITPLTRRPEVELALCRSYNRWMAGIWHEEENRFRWVVVPPLLSMDEALAELRFAKEQGACGVFMRGLEGERRLSNPYFYPLYEEASRLDMPVCVHSANGSPTLHDYFIDESGFAKFKLAVVSAFHSMIFDCVPDRFPRLRTGFIEVSAQWVPYAIHDLRRRLENRRIRGERVMKSLGKDVLRENRIYVACQTDDDLPYVLQYSGDDNLLIGSDYGHNDTSTEIEALRNLKRTGAVSPAAIDKILFHNPKAFYRI